MKRQRFRDTREMARFLLRSSDDNTVLIGPVVTDADGNDYCIVATGHKGEVQVDRLDLTDSGDYRAIIAALAAVGAPLVVAVMDDELAMANLGETIWPTDKMRSIREHVERERQVLQ
jgi:hypothetical protein